MHAAHAIRLSLRPALARALAAVLLCAAPSVQAGSKVLQFTTAAANTVGDVTTLDHPDLNGKPTLKLIITQNWTGVYNPHPVGVSYDKPSSRWEIVNEDSFAMPVGVNFNVLVPEIAKRVNAGPQNSANDLTFFPLQKKNPNALLLATHMIDPYGSILSVYSRKNVGLYFNPPMTTKPIPAYSALWSIYNEDESAPLAIAYNVADVTKDGVKGTPYSFTVTSAAGNTLGNILTFSNPAADGKPGAVLFVNHLFILGTSPTYLNAPLGVSYSGGFWSIFTEDQSTMPLKATFVVDAFPGTTP